MEALMALAPKGWAIHAANFASCLFCGRPQKTRRSGLRVTGRARAGDLIVEGVLAIQNGLSAGQIAHTIHLHPGLAEAVMECAHGVAGAMIHQVKL
jgi:hypothetical protein